LTQTPKKRNAWLKLFYKKKRAKKPSQIVNLKPLSLYSYLLSRFQD
jgi:hypothetical protein